MKEPITEINSIIEGIKPESAVQRILEVQHEDGSTMIYHISPPLSEFAAVGNQWVDKDFDFEQALVGNDKRIIEVAGPTEKGYGILRDRFKYENNPKLWVSNLTNGCPKWNDITGDFIGYEGKVDFQCDSRQIPLPNESTDGVLASCLLDDTRAETLKEIMRILKPGGVIVWQGGIVLDLIAANNLGLHIVEYHERPVNKFEQHMDFILQKPKG